jgi:hypothetical protein
MPAINRIKLSLGLPEHGWLPFCLELDDFQIEDEASNVLNDPFAELLDLLDCSLHPGKQTTHVHFWLEPDGYAIEVTANTRTPQLAIRVYYGTRFYPPERTETMNLVHEGEVHRNRLTNALIEAFTQFIERQNDLHQWGDKRMLERFRALQQERDRFGGSTRE